MTKPKWPKVNTKTFSILEAVDRLSRGTATGRIPLGELYLEVGGSKETIRSLLNLLRKDGLVEIPLRGMYKITAKGLEALCERK